VEQNDKTMELSSRYATWARFTEAVTLLLQFVIIFTTYL